MTSTGISARLILSIFAGAALTQAADWFVLYNSGVEKFRLRMLPDAHRDLKAALLAAETAKAEGSRRAEILHILGQVEFQMGRLRPSIAYHERALGLLPPTERTADLFNISQAYRELGDVRQAERFAREALASSPGDPRVLNLLASILIQQRKYPEAENLAHRAIEKADPALTAMIWTDLAVIEQSRGRYAPAAEMLQRAIAGMPASRPRGRALSNLSDLELRLKRYREAAHHAQQAVEELELHAGPQHPDLCVALERYAGALRHSGRSEEASQTDQRVRQLQSLLGATVDWRSLK